MKLTDVFPDGRSINVAEGILRLRSSVDGTSAHSPNDCRKYDLDLGSTGNTFMTGHQIRVHVSSSNFPVFDRNPNSGTRKDYRELDFRPAAQTVFHSASRASHILLPVVAPDS